MRIHLTPTEWVQVVAEAFRDESGMLVIDVPDSCVQRDEPRIVIANPNIIRFDDRHTQLTSLQHALIRFLVSVGFTAEFEDVKAAVWLDPQVEDGTVRSECSRISKQFRKAGIPWKLSTRGGKTSLLRNCDKNATTPP